MFNNLLEDKKGKNVEINYQGICYKGILIDVLEEEVAISDEEGKIILLPFEGISSVQEISS